MDFFVREWGNTHPHRKAYNQIKIGKKDRGMEPEGESPEKSPFDEFLSHVLTYQITARTTLLIQTVILYSRNASALWR